MLELVARVRALLRRVAQLRAPAGAPTQWQFGGLRLDAERRELSHGEDVIPLTLREFDLLLYLVRHPGRTFGRGELLHNVWGAAFDGYEHTVNSHINRLRSKLELSPDGPRCIATVWGVGYRFDMPAP
jgi:DNA-binding response OmpR family regulator